MKLQQQQQQQQKNSHPFTAFLCALNDDYLNLAFPCSMCTVLPVQEMCRCVAPRMRIALYTDKTGYGGTVCEYEVKTAVSVCLALLFITAFYISFFERISN